MKPTLLNPILRRLVVASCLGALATQSASAAALTWSGGSGNWENGVAGGWSATWSNANNPTTPDTGTFNGPGGTVTLRGNIVTGQGTSAAPGLVFAAGAYTLQSDSASTVRDLTISNANAAGFVSVAPGVIATIGDRVRMTKGSTNGEIRILGGGTLVVGSGNANGGSVLNTTNGANTSFVDNGSKLVVATGGSATFGSSLVIGSLAAGASLEVTGGSLTFGGTGTNLVLGNGTSVTSTVSLKMTAGSIAAANSGNTTLSGGNVNGTLRIGGGTTSTTTGTVDLDGGSIMVNRIWESTISTVNSTVNFNGGTLRAAFVDHTDFIAVDNIRIKSGGAIIDSNGRSVVIPRVLQQDAGSPGGGLTKTGHGALALSGTNTYTGGTTISQGVLAFLNKASVPTSGSISVAAGAGVTLGVKAGDPLFYELSDIDALLTSGNLGTGTLPADALAGIDTTAGDVTYSFTGTTTRGLAKSGTGVLTLSGSNTYSGPTAIFGGSISITAPENLGDGSATNGIILGGGTLTMPTSDFQLGVNRTLSVVSSGTLQVDSGTLIVDGPVSGAGSLTKAGAGSMRIDGNATLTGGVNVNAGILQSGSATVFSGTSPLSVAVGATFDMNGFDASVRSLANVAGSIISSAGTTGVNLLTVAAQAVDGTNALITDDGNRQIQLSFTSNGVGAYGATTNASNTYSGGLLLGNLIRAQVLTNAVGTPGNIVSGPFGRGTITINGGNTNATGAQIWFSTADRTLTNHVIVNGNAGNGNRSGSFRIGATNVAITGNITASGTDCWFGADAAAVLTLNGQLTGPRGFRFYQSNGTAAWTAVLNNLTGLENDYVGNTNIANSQTTLRLGAANQIPNGSGRGNVTLTAGTLDLNGFDETINGLTGAGTIDNVAAGSGNTLTLGDGNASPIDAFTGVIRNTTGTLSVTKIGSGTQTFSAAQAYTGTTSVLGGALAINGSLNAASAVLVGGAVASGSPTLCGTGTVPGSVTIAAADGGAAGRVNPGAVGAIGTLNVGPTTIAGTLAVDLNATTSDVLAVTGNLDLNGSSLAVNALAEPTANSYTLITYTGNLSGALTVQGSLPVGYTLDYSTPGQVNLVQQPAAGYDAWANTNQISGGAGGDHDGDGIPNLVEYALGLNAAAPNASPGTFNGTEISFSKGAEVSGVTYVIETSTTLGNDWTPVTPTAEDASSIRYTLPVGQTKVFARLKVTQAE